MPLYVCNGTTGTQRCRCTPATGPLARSDAVVRLQRGRWHAAMPLYACNGAADTQRCRCTSATGPLTRSDAVVRLQRGRWHAACRCTSATGPLGRSGAVVRVQRPFPLSFFGILGRSTRKMPTFGEINFRRMTRLTKFPLLLLLAILVAGVFSSCGSRRQEKVILPADFKGPKELSRLYGVRLTPDDNIYLYNAGAHWLGVPHRMGGLTKRGVDCSGFVTIIYREVYGKQLARSAADMLKHDCKRVRRGKLREGDLVFFRTGRGRKREPNHVGIYLKNGRFIHTSTSRGVMVSSLSEPYYERTWICGGRVK